MNHSEAMGNVAPPLQRKTGWSELIAQRPADEPHPAFGTIIAAGLLGILMFTGLCFTAATGGFQ